MDIYRTETAQTEQTAQPVMLFVFGGAFMKGERDKPYYIPYFRELAAQRNYRRLDRLPAGTERP
ncbi:MAG: hypothetical protein ACLR8Y_13070 [Alistipes indistinctus]